MLNHLYDISFQDLYNRGGLAKIDALFLEQLYLHDPHIYSQLRNARTSSLEKAAESELLLCLAPFIEIFFADLFQLHEHVAELKEQHNDFEILLDCKRNFVQRYVAKQLNLSKEETLEKLEEAQSLLRAHGFDMTSEVQMAKKIHEWQLTNTQELLDAAAIYASHMLHNHKQSILFHSPKKLDYSNLVEIKIDDESIRTSNSSLRNRQGFSLNDSGISLLESVDQAKYCIHCHKQNKDSCSQGMHDKTSTHVTRNSLKNDLYGCPLDEKISEMNYLKAKGFVLSPLAVAIIDNPMLAATGHRICNDCTKACIYQKQEPVNIPLIETETLQTVLDLPYGFEIYSLLTRWNPMNFAQWLPSPLQEHKVLIAGLGPAGFTLAHYLLNQGVIVVAIDGLKIEPLSPSISGIDQSGVRSAFIPIRNIADIAEDLDQRIAYGFGGVAEYGITNRWNKNYLKIIRLLLERRENFRMYGSIRFGSNITYDQAKTLGFDHVALALGAGSPNLPNIPNVLAQGVRTASDFLMSLQLLSAARSTSLANLQIELPILVIGGGLTAVDAATESINYYASQVEKLLALHECFGASIFNELTAHENQLLQKFLEHARTLRAYPDKKSSLLQEWGGVKIAYRKSMQESPGYRLNHEELAKALEEGVQFVENIVPVSIKTDESGHCIALKHANGEIAARTILIAIGTNPNTVLASEDSTNFTLQGDYLEKSEDYSTFGDLHPSYNGNVVKAMASAKNGYPTIIAKFSASKPRSTLLAPAFFREMDDLLLAEVTNISRLTGNIVQVTVRSKLAAKNFKPGQFYRLQNFEANAIALQNYKLAMEPLALTGASVNGDLLSMIVLEMGGSSNFCQHLRPGEFVALMGPTGSPTSIPSNKKVLLMGGGLGNAVLFSIGQAMREQGCQVLYFAGYKKLHDRYMENEIEKAADIVVWCCDEGFLKKNRQNDFSFDCNLVEALSRYQSCCEAQINLSDIEHMVAIGSDQMMAAITYARYNKFKSVFKNEMTLIGSINSPMQCMMKQICGQCLQRHIEADGSERYVYSCFEQDQDLSKVDFHCLHQRLTQNALLEKATRGAINELSLYS